jgi:L,D-peptidoglycan transpeptidase YkuD (ErfK/YbiS/YcfS/YnhG family)
LQRLHQLKTEALQRTRHAGTHALNGTYPEPLRFLSPSVQQVVVVDAQKSRLYLLAHKNDGPGLGRLHVLFDAYISIGNKGMGKWREGDTKTPAGVYFVQKHMTDFMLPDLYGSGALTLDYPNPLDKQQQRTGSGIWLHGSPSEQYARPPTATDGCVVLANDDMLQLVKLGVRSGTPVLIAEQLKWLNTPLSSTLVKSASGTDVTKSWPLQPQQIQQKTGNWTLASAFEWTDQLRTVAVLTHELQTPGQPPQRIHSYWAKNQQQWKEVSGI